MSESKIEKQRREVLKNSNKLNLDSYLVYKSLEESLRKAGIQRPKHGPRINEHVQILGKIYT